MDKKEYIKPDIIVEPLDPDVFCTGNGALSRPPGNGTITVTIS